jgi:hypothetical protein
MVADFTAGGSLSSRKIENEEKPWAHAGAFFFKAAASRRPG